MPLRQAQIICGAFVAGLVTVSVVLGGLAYAGVASVTPALLPPLAGAVALALPASVLLGIAIKASVQQQARLDWLRERDEGDPMARFEGVYGRGTIVQAALLEGFGVLGPVCAFVTGQMLFMASPLIAILGIGLIFPTEGKFRSMVDRLTRPPSERELRLLESISEGQ